MQISGIFSNIMKIDVKSCKMRETKIHIDGVSFISRGDRRRCGCGKARQTSAGNGGRRGGDPCFMPAETQGKLKFPLAFSGKLL